MQKSIKGAPSAPSTLFKSLVEMPSRPRTKRREVPPHIRAEMYGMRQGGATYNQISQAYPPWTIRTIQNNCRLAEAREKHASLPQSDAPRRTTPREDRRLLKEACRSAESCRQPLCEINANVVPQISRCLVQRQLKEGSIRKHPVTERPLLSSANRRQHYAWAREHESWGWNDWKKVCWCDEMSVCKINDTTTSWIFRLPWEKWDEDCIDGVPQGSRVSLMFFGCIQGTEKGLLESLWPQMERTGKKGITGLIILDALRDSVPTLMTEDSILMLDNTKTHTIQEIKDWISTQDYTVMKWPPYSPDLNPIEMV